MDSCRSKWITEPAACHYSICNTDSTITSYQGALLCKLYMDVTTDDSELAEWSCYRGSTQTSLARLAVTHVINRL